MKRYALALDLKNDPLLIESYDQYHQAVWPEVISSIKESGIRNMQIYRVQNRLFMLIETSDDFSFALKNVLDKGNEKVQEWEALMWRYQQALPGAPEGSKWMLMDKVFEL